jgi:DNA mismatch repair ATPase MutS
VVMTYHSRTKEGIQQEYRQKIDRHGLAIQKLKKEKSFISIARLTTMIIGLGSTWYLWPSSIPISIILFITFVLFIFLIFRDVDKSAAIQNYERLTSVNRQELDTIQHNLNGYYDGMAFTDSNHAYASDLDLFGPQSIFQWLSRCHADQSKKLLADRLKSPLHPELIKNNQEAAKELSEKQESCQQYQSLAIESPLSLKTERTLKDWSESPSAGFEKSYWKWIQNLYPIIPLTVLTIYILNYMSNRTFVFCLIGFYMLYILVSKKIGKEFETLFKIEPEVDAVYKQLQHIENEKFSSSLLKSLQNRLKPNDYSSASAAVKDFHGILKRIEFRSNLVVSPVLQFILMWDLRQVISLNEWKKKNKLQMNDWFGVIAEMEVSISVASLVYNEPAWCFPDLDKNYFHFKALKIGHPLIPTETRIANDFEMSGTGKVALITGSNMAGKSTFLRSLGVNTVLAQMGSPVCAEQMKLSMMVLISSMRVADNLAENTSTFYAELKKLQYIIGSVNRKEHVFILLDEVLRGTNSVDRHKGSKALIRQLLEAKAAVVMATHDTELAVSESMAAPSVSNYHFEGKIIDDELYFDYKIRKGICESLNATTLMKKIGIHFQD